MNKLVKNKRRYHSPLRREQADATRRVILEAAQRLFVRHGYAATTMAAIATEAGVALKMIYIACEAKSGILRELWNQLLRGSDDDAPVADQGWYREVLQEPDPERQLRLNARNSRIVKLRIAAIVEVIRGGALVDPAIAALWGRIQAEFHANQRVIVLSLQRKNALIRGLGIDRAADLLWTLNHPDVWQLLIQQRGWTPRQYERWFGDISCAQLLRRVEH